MYSSASAYREKESFGSDSRNPFNMLMRDICSSDLGPLTISFPDPQCERKGELLLDPCTQEFANILDRGIFKKIIEVSMVILGENIAQRLLQVGKIHDHAVFRLAFDNDF